LVNYGRDYRRASFQLDAASFDFKKIENIVDGDDKVSAAFVNRASKVNVLRVPDGPLELTVNDFRETDNGIERRAEFATQMLARNRYSARLAPSTL
jgi:hypothetical protein